MATSADSLSDNRRLRWSVLILASLTMMAGYVFWDIVSPVSSLLTFPNAEGGLGWTEAEYGFYAGSYSIFNIFLFMLFFGGVILDKCGIRLTGVLATGSMLLGALINLYAITSVSPQHTVTLSFTFFGFIPDTLKTQVLVAALGFGIFGMGCDITGITISKVITKWFTGHELASAMGIQVALARLGTALALSFSPLLALHFRLSGVLIAGCVILFAGFLLFLVYIPLDRRFDRRQQMEHATSADTLSWRSFLQVLRNPGFWLIALLCVFFYSSIRPFMKFASEILILRFQVDSDLAGFIVAIIPYGTILFTPLFGSLYDRFGHGVVLMVIGCAIVTLCHFLLAQPFTHSTPVAVVLMILFGIAFSLVPSVLWPSVPKIVRLEQLGTAYSIIYYIQNIGLMLVPVWVGSTIDHHVPTTGGAEYTDALLIFAVLGLLSIVTALLLLWTDRHRHFGLEEPNIEKQSSV